MNESTSDQKKKQHTTRHQSNMQIEFFQHAEMCDDIQQTITVYCSIHVYQRNTNANTQQQQQQSTSIAYRTQT